MGGSEVKQQAAVDHTAVFCVEVGQCRQPWLRLFAADATGKLEKVLPGDPDDPDTATTLRRGDGGDRFSRR